MPGADLLSSLPRPIITIVIGLWRRRWLIAGIAWLAALLGWSAVALLPDLYESRAQVYINTDTALDATISDVAVRPNREKGVQVIRTQLLSSDNLEKVIYATGLDAEVEGPVDLQRKVASLAEAIRIEQTQENYFTFKYADKDPQTAQRVVATLVDLFIEQNLSNATTDVGRAVQNLDRELALKESELKALDDEIAVFKSVNADILAAEERKVRRRDSREGELARVSDLLSLARARESRLATALRETPRYAPGDDLDALKLRLATLQSQFTDNYPDIVRLKAQIAELERNSSALPENPVYAETARSLAAIRDEIAGLMAQRDRIEEEIVHLGRQAAETPEAEAELQALVRRREQLARTVDNLAEQQSRIRISSNVSRGGGAINYQRFEAPKVAAEPTWPPRGLFVLAVFVLALGAGGAAAFLLTQIDRTYTHVGQIEKAFGLPVLGAVSPSIPDGSRTKRLILLRHTGLAGAFGALLIACGSLFWWYEIYAPAAPDPTALATNAEPGRLR